MRLWLKRIALTLLAVTAIVLIVIGVVAWRATRVPAWYATAVEQTPPDEVADVAINDKFVPLQNWLARSSSGDPAARPDSAKVFTLELTDNEVNALLAKFFDHIQGQCQAFRVRLTPGQIDVAFKAAFWSRDWSINLATGAIMPADASPSFALKRIEIGNQTAPGTLVSSAIDGQAKRLRASLDAQRTQGKPAHIDEQDTTSNHTVEAYYGRRMLDALAGRSVSPYAFLPLGTNEKWVATRIVHLELTDGHMAITFRLLDAQERAAVLAELAGPLPGT